MPNNADDATNVPVVIVQDRALEAKLARKNVTKRATREFARAIAKGRSNSASFAELLSDIYNQVAACLEEAKSDISLNPKQRMELLYTASKTLPALQAAERNARIEIKKKALEDLTTDELLILVEARQKPNSPLELTPGVVVPPPVENEKNEITQSVMEQADDIVKEDEQDEF